MRQIKAHTERPRGEAYKQCHLVKGNRHEIAYIPTEYAVVGQSVKIRRDGTWEDGWLVEWAFEKEVDVAFLDGMRNAWKHQREVSDI